MVYLPTLEVLHLKTRNMSNAMMTAKMAMKKAPFGIVKCLAKQNVSPLRFFSTMDVGSLIPEVEGSLPEFR